MTRQIPVWAMAAVLCAAATGAWGQMEPRERARGRTDQPLAERERPAPKLTVIRFEHVPAASFMGVLEQLSRRGPGEKLGDAVTVAMHQESNAVVLLAPPEAAEHIVRLARELDQPSAFHERMRDRQAEDKRQDIRRLLEWREGGPGALRELWQRWADKGPGRPEPPRPMGPKAGPQPCPMCGMCPMAGMCPMSGPEQPGPMCDGCPMAAPKKAAPKPLAPKPPAPKPLAPKAKPRPIEPPRETYPQRPMLEGPPAGKPSPAPDEMILSPKVVERLRLRPDQIDRIRQIIQEQKTQAMHLRERIANALAGMEPGQRAVEAKELGEKARQRLAELVAQGRQRIMEVLEPAQREEAGRVFRPQMPRPMPQPEQMQRQMEDKQRQMAEMERQMAEKEQQLREAQQRLQQELERMQKEKQERLHQEHLRLEREQQERQERLRREREGKSEKLERDLLVGGMDL